MTLYALGDYHGRSIQEFVEAVSPSEKDTILSTGDFDQAEIINDFLEFKEGFEGDVIDVLGNHDHALLEKIPITSGTIEAQDKHYHEMIDELHADNRSKQYLQGLLGGAVKEFEIGGLKGVLVHGGLAGHIQSSNITEEMENFWYRLWEDEDFEANFDIMDREDYDLMIRGHDHRTDHAMRLKDAYKAVFRSEDLGQSYELDPSYNHLVTHGAWYKGQYIAIDEESLEIEFRQI